MEQDFLETYGIILDDSVLLSTRSWRWLVSMVLGLLNIPPDYLTGKDKTIVVHRTRLARKVMPQE